MVRYTIRLFELTLKVNVNFSLIYLSPFDLNNEIHFCIIFDTFMIVCSSIFYEVRVRLIPDLMQLALKFKYYYHDQHERERCVWLRPAIATN